MAADWAKGIRNKENQTPDDLRRCAEIALERARDWVVTAEQLLEKADDISAIGERT